jgi:hypothetical protein
VCCAKLPAKERIAQHGRQHCRGSQPRALTLTCIGQVAAHSHTTAEVSGGLVAASRAQAGQGMAVLHVRLAPLGLQHTHSSSNRSSSRGQGSM